ncbi:hypothetical protein GGI23_003433, partial [Coemansia sp. RSA 2559]
MPLRPEKLATDELMENTNKIGKDGVDVVEKIKITDEEVSRIFDSIMSAEQRKERDAQSLRHKTRTEYSEMIDKSKEKRRLQAAQRNDDQGCKQATESADESKPKVQPMSEETMEKLIYMDTRLIREMEEAKLAVLASADALS